MSTNLTFDNGMPVLKTSRSAFDLSNEYNFDCDYSRAIPVDFYDCIPGDKFNLSNSCLIRTNPLIKPAYTLGLKGKFRSFFVPYRIIYKKFEDMFTGGRDGKTVVPIPVIRYYPKFSDKYPLRDSSGCLLDYFRLPNILNSWQDTDVDSSGPIYLNAFYFLAYIKIWNDYFRNTRLQPEIDVEDFTIYDAISSDFLKFDDCNYIVNLPDGSSGLDVTLFFICALDIINNRSTFSGGVSIKTLKSFLVRDYNTDYARIFYFLNTLVTPFMVNSPRDYFTSSLPTPELGTRPLVPVNFSGSSNWSNDIVVKFSGIDGSYRENVKFNSTSIDSGNGTPGQISNFLSTVASVDKDDLNNNSIVNASGAGFYPEQLRLSFALDLKNQIIGLSGTRFMDVVESIYGVSPNSDVLNMAKFLGGYNIDIFTSEVLQTSSSDNSSVLGSYGGHGIGSQSGFIGDYFVEEPGCIITLFYVNSNTLYSNGIRRDFLKYSINDYVFPFFTNLGEQEVYNCELFYDPCRSSDYSDDGNLGTFGYQARYNDYRYIPDSIAGTFRSSSKVWTQAKYFKQPSASSNPDNLPSPTLNSGLLRLPISQANRIFNNISVDSSVSKNFIIRLLNKTVAFRPLPEQSIGSFIDHFGL